MKLLAIILLIVLVPVTLSALFIVVAPPTVNVPDSESEDNVAVPPIYTS